MRFNRLLKSLLLTLISLGLFSQCVQKQSARQQAAFTSRPQPLIIKPAPFQRGMWVRAVSIASADSLARIITIAKEMHITDLYVQTVVGGYAYYRSELLPRSQYLAEVSPPYYDPLDSLIKVAQQESLRVHAWVNALLVWSLQSPPDSARHIYYTHPEWFIKDVTGQSMHEYTCQNWLESGLEGLYLDPALPAVQEHVANICSELARQYPITGIHLDFIRYPGTLWGLHGFDTAYVFAGLKGYDLRWLSLTRYAQMPFLERWLAWHNWKQFVNKRNKINEIVDKIYVAIQINPVNPEIILTTAVFADPSMGLYRFSQDWPTWTVIAYPIVMSYYENLDPFLDAFIHTNKLSQNAIYGIGLLWENTDTIAFMQTESVISQGGTGFCYFDFTSLDTLVSRAVLLGQGMTFSLNFVNQDTMSQMIYNIFAQPPPDGIIEDSLCSPDTSALFSQFLMSLSLNPQSDLKRMAVSPEQFAVLVNHDVMAFYSLDSHVFPLPDTLIAPPSRTIQYEFYPWDGQDSITVLSMAKKTKIYSKTLTTPPNALNPVSRAAFSMELGKKQTIKTQAGVYALQLLAESQGGGKTPRSRVPSDSLPFYVSWTALYRAQQILNRCY